MKATGKSALRWHAIFLLFLLVFLPFLKDQNVCASDIVTDKNHASCVSCHRISPQEISGTNLFPEGVEPSSSCLDCHHYSDNHHPVNFVPKSTFMNAGRESFPLFDGEIKCLTCHKVHGEQGGTGRPMLLRGGPYASRTEICFLCHDKGFTVRVNPHRMTDEQGTIRKIDGEPICLVCHAAVPDETVSPVTVTFKADVAFLCWRCHPPMANDGFFKGHFLVKPKKRTLDYMMKVQAEDGVTFPLLNRDRITCSTCHNPHQKGVISSGPARAGEDAPFKLRMPNESICFGCHNM
ncbi:MAG TPA: cytochrome c3 family protein [Thermodesulfovibrionales bacterium]|nr:cytochrome c3 family protein [Thermodesulfovibrionales bacterium]